MMGPILLGTPKKQATTLALDWLRRVGLAGFEDRYPHQLSGGMRKRVAMAAALINSPRILLMDEPFGALDVQTKAIMQAELLQLWEELRPSVLFITHDLDEAVALSDRVVIMTSSPGTVKDVFDIDLPRPRGDVQEIRHEPRFLELQGRDLGVAEGRGHARLRASRRRVAAMSAATAQTAPRRRETDLQATGRRARSRRTTFVWLGRLLVVVVVIGGWQWFTRSGWVDKFFYGQPTGIWDSLVSSSPRAPRSAPSGSRSGSRCRRPSRVPRWARSWASSSASCSARTATSPTCSTRTSRSLNSIPRIVLGSIFIVAFGLGLFPKVLLAAVLVFFAVFFNAYQGVREVDQNLIANVRVLGASPLQIARHVTIPSAMTWIIASLHTAFGFAIIGALVAEVLGALQGIGLIISQAQGRFDPDTVFACMVIIAVVTLGRRIPHHPPREGRPEVAAAVPFGSPRPI